MNFKFTKAKTIISIIISIVFGVYFFNQPIYFNNPFGIILNDLVYHFVGLALRFMASFFVIYSIWSFFQERIGESEMSRTIGFIFSALILIGMGYLMFYILTVVL